MSKARLNRQASQPINTRILTNLATIACSGCTVAFLAFGAPLGVLLGGIAAGAGGIALHVRYRRRMRAWATGTKPEPLWRPGGSTYVPGQHKPTCRARSAATCRCRGRRTPIAARKPTPKRKTTTRRAPR